MALIEFEQKAITREEFEKIRSLKGNYHGCKGTRKEYFVVENLIPENAVCFRYSTDEDFRLSYNWMRELARRKNLAKNAYIIEFVGDKEKREIYVLKRYLDKEDN